jgi:hypothetical protein
MEGVHEATFFFFPFFGPSSNARRAFFFPSFVPTQRELVGLSERSEEQR